MENLSQNHELIRTDTHSTLHKQINLAIKYTDTEKKQVSKIKSYKLQRISKEI